MFRQLYEPAPVHTVVYDAHPYALIDHHGAGMPDPTCLRAEKPGSGCTGSVLWEAIYRLDEVGLTLTELELRGTEKFVPLGEVEPVRLADSSRYRDLSMPIPFTGVLMLGKDRIGSPSMVRTPELEYGTVLDLIMIEGEVVAVSDRSTEMEERREAMAQSRPMPHFGQLGPMEAKL